LESMNLKKRIESHGSGQGREEPEAVNLKKRIERLWSLK